MVFDAYKASDAAERGVHLVAVGCGTPAFAKSFAETNGFQGDTLHIFVDDDLSAYKQMGLVYGNPGCSGQACADCCVGTWIALWRGITKCWCICSAGDVEQQGGAFVMSPDDEVLFRHIEQHPGDHADPQRLLKAAGVDSSKA